VGRVWPRHGHRGQPLNSVVRQQAPFGLVAVATIVAAQTLLCSLWLRLGGAGPARATGLRLVVSLAATVPAHLACLLHRELPLVIFVEAET